MVTGPGVPSPITHSPLALLTLPTGVITAAVPQANTSVSSPEAHSSRHWSAEILPSPVGNPRSGPRVSSESRVIPGSMVPVSAGVMIRASAPVP